MARSTPPVVMASRNSAGGMVSDRRFNFGALTLSCSSRRGRNTSSPMSEAESEKVRSALAGSKARSRRISKRTVRSRGAPARGSTPASGVGCIEAPCRTKSSSPNTSRSLPSEKLTVGWLTLSRSATSVVLPVSYMASRISSRLRSISR